MIGLPVAAAGCQRQSLNFHSEQGKMKKTWTEISKAKETALAIRRASRWGKGQKYIPLYRKIWRAVCAFWEAVGVSIVTNGYQQI